VTDHSRWSAPDDHLGPDGYPVPRRWDGDARASLAVVEAVAGATGREPTELPVLADAVDTDALDALFRAGPDGRRPPTRLSFDYAGVEVQLRGDGRVTVEPRGSR